MNPDIFSFIKSREAEYETEQVRVGENWYWNMKDHVQMIFHLKHGVFYTGENNWMRAFKQVMLPLLRLSYWTEDIEVKDITFFIEGKDDRALSFLVKKYHDEVYVREHDLDTMIDEVTESDIDYGGALLQNSAKERPEVLPFQTVAFADQTDLLGGPIAFKHHFSPDKLRQMGKLGWGDEKNGATISIEDLVTLATFERDPLSEPDGKENRTPGKTIEVYIVRGNLPEAYLKDNDNMELWYNQVQIVAFYTDKNKKKQGVVLYRKKEVEGNLKLCTTEKIPGRGLGYSDGEAFIHPQIWTNFLTIHKMSLLEAASKVPLFTDDPAYQNRNKIQDMENLEITTIDPASKFGIQQVPTAAPGNIQLYQNSINEWFEHSQLLGAAFDPILGKEPNSGTTFRGQERTVAQGRGWHDRRRGQRAKFLESVYRDWIIPQIKKEILGGKKFLASLTVEELSWIADQLATNYANQKLKEKMLKGELPTNEERDELVRFFKESFTKSGNKKMLEILKGEFDDVEIRMGINIAGKQKDLVMLSDKLLSIFQFIFANPAGFQQAMQIPALSKSFYDILEFSGMSQVDFMTLLTPPPPEMQQPQMQGQQGQPQMQLSQPVSE